MSLKISRSSVGNFLSGRVNFSKPGGIIDCDIIIVPRQPLAHAWEDRLEKQKALDLLGQIKQEAMTRFGATSLGLYGSTARDTATAESDVDILVSFDGPATADRFFGLQFYLEDCLHCPVDLVTDKALRSELRAYVEKDLIYV